MTQQSLEDRVAFLERKIAEYEAERAQIRDLAGLRADVSELRVRYQAHEEYVTDRLNSFEEHITVRLDVIESNHEARLADLGERIGSVEASVGQLQAGQQELQTGLTGLAGQMQSLAAGQQQILELLQGGPPKVND